MEVLDIVLICTYFLIIAYLGVTVKASQTIKEYAIGDNTISTYSLVSTVFATWIGSIALLNTVDKGFSIGISYFLVILGDVINLILYGLLAKFFHKHFKAAISIGDIIEPTFGLSARIVSGILCFLVCLCYITAQFKAINLLFEYFFSVPHFISITISTLIIASYTFLGGVNSVVKIDKFQFVVILLFIILLLNNVAPKSLNHLSIEKLTFNIDKSFAKQYLGVFIGFMIPLILPNAVQRIMIAKNPHQCRNAFFISSFLSLIFYSFCIILGVFAFSINPDLQEAQALFFLLRHNLTTGLLGIGFIGVFSILISTVDSFMNIASVGLVHDVLKPVFRDKISDSAELTLARLCIILVSVLACLLSIKFDEILEVILYSLNLWAPIMSVPLYFIIFRLKVHKYTFYISLFCSSLMSILWENNADWFSDISGFIPGTILSLTIFTASWLITKFNLVRSLPSLPN